MTKPELSVLYQQTYKGVYRFFYVRTLSKQMAEDLTSETYLGLLKQLDKIKNPQAKKYLYAVAYNVINSHLRKIYQLSMVPLTAEMVSNEIKELNQSSNLNLEELVATLLPQLSETQAEIVRERLINKSSLEEISRKLNKDYNYIKVNQHRAIAKLKEIVACTPLSNMLVRKDEQ